MPNICIMKAWIEEDSEFLIKYFEDYTDEKLGILMNRSTKMINKKRYELGLIKKGKFSREKYNFDKSFFRVYSQNLAYFLGIMYADGTIDVNRNQLDLTLKDKTILDSIVQAMNSNFPVVRRGDLYNLKICRKYIIEKLVSYGLTSNKTFTMSFPTVPKEYLFHFIRGYFDGDGHVRINNKSITVIFVSASKEFLTSMQNYLIINQIDSSITSQTVNKKNSFRLRIKTRSISEFRDLIYKDAIIYLQRKYEVFKR